jgi:hypothetical protein
MVFPLKQQEGATTPFFVIKINIHEVKNLRLDKKSFWECKYLTPNLLFSKDNTGHHFFYIGAAILLILDKVTILFRIPIVIFDY